MKRPTDRRGSHRRHDRISFIFHYLQKHVRLETVDLSLDGAMLESPIVFPSGTMMVLEYFSGQPGDVGIRLLARVSRVTRSLRGHSSSCGLGVHWIRAYTLGQREYLADFLVNSLGYPPNVMDSATPNASGVWSVTLHSVAPPAPVAPPQEALAEASAQLTRFNAGQRGRFRIDVPVMYSLGNMHYRGTVVALGTSGIGVLSPGSLPFLTAKATIRFPLADGPQSPKVMLFTEVEFVAEPPHPGGVGAFSGRILGIDELDSPGAFRAYLKALPTKFSLWP